ncbi:hypothetical protein [Cellulomonas oligotrophica]|uniref:Uncharacterized protein n=1 Tax=Cellulomonas oligotrophica TaxID=931536 RepID=A0A7Y9JZM1_9CELL|nr:hypothetical protein [Cellulomonas oligotrophica]NYD88037.1 hypothetical protein [Cellulomonas oligotrophica]GIG33545.1 hypothetical protein Col01nite_27040 [Cellulomonas oligotrophica]
MSRPTSWYPLAFGDPVPGDPVAVRAAAEEHQRVADQIAAAVEELRGTALGSGQRATVVDALEGTATRVADGIEAAHGRYVTAALALDTYADRLAEAQATSYEAWQQATDAEQARVCGQDEAWRQRELARDQADPALAAHRTALADAADAGAARAESRLADARLLLAQAQAHRDAAAEEARGLVVAVVAVDGLVDTAWQDVQGGVKDVDDAIGQQLDDIALVLGVAAVALCWVPGLNAALAAAATIAGVAVLVRDVALLVTGQGSWLDVGLGALSLVTFGLGRVAARGVRLAADTSRASAGLRAAGAGTRSARSGVVGPSGLLGAGATAALRAVPTRARPLLNRTTLATLKPGAVLRDGVTDLRGGWQTVRTAVQRPPTATGAHAQGPAARTPFGEAFNPVKDTWQTSRVAGVFHAVGAEGVARDLAFLAQQGEPRTAWALVNVVPQVEGMAQTTNDVVQRVRG